MPRLYKKEKLCSQIMIERLFAPRGEQTHGTLAFPIRCVWAENSGRHCDAPLQFLISVPKKRLRHAVDRVTMRRRIREAYRLNRDSYPLPEGTRIDVAFIYIDSRLQPYAAVDHAMKTLLKRISTALADKPAELAATSSETNQ